MIGQFCDPTGRHFHDMTARCLISAYLSSDKVRVVSMINGDEQYFWASVAGGFFSCAE